MKLEHTSCPSYYPNEVIAWGVTLMQFPHEDEEGNATFIYNATIDLELNSNEGKHLISVVTQIFEECPHCTLKQACMMGSGFGDTFFSNVLVMDESGEEIDLKDERLNVNFIMDELEEESEDILTLANIPTPSTIH